MKPKIFLVPFFVILSILACFDASAEDYIDKDKFFSYDRFFISEKVISRIPGKQRTRNELEKFAVSFIRGLYAISDGELREAEKELLKARRVWPEYFGTDFLLGLVYEDSDNPKKAARYYKSYLNKLKKFHAGEYRISGPLIRYFAPYDIERYEPAREAIKKHLEIYGIRLSKVRPVYTFPTFLLPLLLVTVLAVLYTATVQWFLPYIKKQRRIKNPPEGFWICRRCGTANTELNKVCEECGRERGE
jgi:tetratricopeptide (TPR) repeat protein